MSGPVAQPLLGKPLHTRSCALYLSDNDVFSGPSSKHVRSLGRERGAGLTLALRCHFAGQDPVPIEERQAAANCSFPIAR